MEAEVAAERTIRRIATGRIYGSTEVAMAVLDDLRTASGMDAQGFARFLSSYVPRYISARPTDVVLINVLREFLSKYAASSTSAGPPRAVVPGIIDGIVRARESNKRAIADIGAKRMRDGDVVMLHSYSLTVIGMIRKAVQDLGLRLTIYVTESKPIGEGLKVAEDLEGIGDGVDIRLIVDSAVRYFMKDVDKVVVGADAVAANGAVVNKIGTSVVALAAKEARVNFYVAAETYKFSFETLTGELVPQMTLSDFSLIASAASATRLAGKAIVRAPIFDVTPPEYIDAVITEKGVIAPQAIPLLIRDVYGWPPRISSIGELLEEVARSA